MLTWDSFLPFALAAAGLWALAALTALFHKGEGKSQMCLLALGGGIVVYCIFIAGLWVGLERPPLRTLGETRLWYSLFMMVSAWMVYARWHYRWLPLTSLVVALVFIIINLVRPDIHDQSLMPALQSAWFIPHVTVYMFSYSLFGCAFCGRIVAQDGQIPQHHGLADTHRFAVPYLRDALGLRMG